ncbi:MAG: hypothetical protein LC791_19430, partial [Acidobacteria bacterium]|nr:hypothetical protein [Acidobacteriota bacterium]
IEDGARVSIVEGSLLITPVDLRGAQNHIERRYSRNGVQGAYESEGRLWLTGALSRLVEQGGLFAEQRVERLLVKEGPDAVLSAIDRFPDENSYARRRYYEELLRQAPHTAELLSQIIVRVGRGPFGDYERGQVLTRVAESAAVTDGHRTQIAATSRSIAGDYEQKRVLMATMPEQPAQTVAHAILAAAADLNGDHERGTLLAALAQRGGVTIQSADVFLGLVRQIGNADEQRRALTELARGQSVDEAVALQALQTARDIASEHDRRQVVGAFLAGLSAVGPGHTAAVLMTAATLRSGHERSLVLLDVLARGGLTADTADAFFEVVSGLGSHEHRRVLEAAIDRQLSESVLMLLMRNAAKIDSEYERASLLARLAATHELSSEQRMLYIDVADGMRSEHEQSRALAALVRGERRRTR